MQPLTLAMKVSPAIRVTVPLALALFAPCVSLSQLQRNLGPDTAVSPLTSENGKYYAIVIGINHYPSPLPSLVTAVNDARAIADELTKDYGFQVKLLLDGDATRSHILDSIMSFHDKLNENDNLLIYYAGHGYRAGDKAYWLPADTDSIYSSNRIIADELTADVRGQNARHILIISDSCYSGGLSRDFDSPTESAGRTAFLNRMLRSRSRTLMASGGNEPVSDSGTEGHSVFAYAVLRSLIRPHQDIFTGSDLLYGSVRQQVAGKSSQVPQYAYIRNSNDDEGDFVFVRIGAQLSSSQASSPQMPTVGQTTPVRPSDSFVTVGNLTLSDADKTQIRDLLDRYARAVNVRDVKQLRAAWPEIPAKKIEEVKTLPKGARISLSPTTAQLLDTNENAVVRCKQTYELNGKSEEDNVTFYLGRLNAGWIINQIPSSN